MYKFTVRFVGAAIFLCAVFADVNMSSVFNRRTATSENDQGFQSPINIIKKFTKMRKLPPLRTRGYLDFEDADVKIINTGQTVTVMIAEDTEVKPYIIYGGPLFKSKYVFQDLHFHWGEDEFGSEHEIDYKKYAMEVHLVHFKKDYGSYENAKNYKDGLCVVSFFGKITKKDNDKLSKFMKDLKHVKKPNIPIFRSFKKEFSWLKNIINLTHLKKNYFVYNGSLTTSPYTECVIWIIYTNKIGVSRKQLSKFRNLHSNNGGFIDENIRSIQPINERTIIHAV